jgi:hypothetical protein
LLAIDSDKLVVDVADNNHMRLDLVVIAFDPSGKILANLTQQIDLHLSGPKLDQLRRGGFAYAEAVEVPRHTSVVRFIVRDYLNERIGTVSIPIEARP